MSKKQPISPSQPTAAQEMPKIWETKPFLVAVLGNLLLFGVIYLFFTPHFQENDDVGMLLEAAGKLIASEPTPYLLFTHIIIGYILKTLYSISPQTAWYGYYLVFCLFVTHVGIFYIILKRLPSILGVILYFIYFLVAATHPLTSFQFTTVAALASMAGFAILLFLHEKDWKVWIFGIFLILLGSLVRFQSLILAVIMFLPVILYYLITDSKRIIKNSIPLGISFVLLGGVFMIQRYAYQQNGWAEFDKVNKILGEFVDNQALSKASPEAQQKALQKANWTMVDYAMMGNWFFVDKNIYGFERLNAAISELGIENRELKTDEIWAYQKNEILGRDAVLRCLTLMVFFSFLFRNGKFEWATIGLSVLMMPFLLAAIHFVLKQPPMHVYHPMFMHLALLPLFLLNKENSISLKDNNVLIQKIGTGVMSLLILSASFKVLGELSEASKQAKENRRNLRNLVANLNPNAQNLYVVWANSFPYELLTPFESLDFVENLKIFTLGSVQRTPIADKVLEKNQIDNIYTALATKPNVFFILRADYLQRWLGLYSEFMKQHYQKQITARPVTQNGNVVVVDVDFQN